MAKFFLLIRPLSRGRGTRATRAAAYRAGEMIRDERSGRVYDFSDRGDVAYKEIVLPSQVAGSADASWARDRATLWNAAEHAGHRRNSRVAREVLVFLPPELTPTRRTNLVRSFAQALTDKYRNAVDVTIHPPRPGADERHHHAHLLMTTREVTAHGLGPRTAIELGGKERQARGLGPARNEYFWVREQWAQITNEALREAGLAERIDHRSLKDQGLDREPIPVIPQKIYYAEKRSGRSTQAGDDIRARYRERVEARLKGPDELARVLEKQREEARQRAVERSKQMAGEQALERQKPGLTAEDSARAWRERRARLGPGATAEESVRKWRELRARLGPDATAEEWARESRDFKERQKQPNLSQTRSEERSHQRGPGGIGDDDNRDRKTDRSLDNDYDYSL
jgi:MobA/MobL family